MQSAQGLPIKTIKKATAQLTHELVRNGALCRRNAWLLTLASQSSKDRSSRWLISFSSGLFPLGRKQGKRRNLVISFLAIAVPWASLLWRK